MRKTYYSWNDVDEFVEDVVSIVFDMNFTKILAIGRGGFVPGVMLSNALDIPLTVVMAKSYKGVKKGKTYVSKFLNLKGSITEKDKVLVVDDIYDTGETLKLICKKLKNYKTAVMITRDQYVVDYFYHEQDKDVWVVFPWEVERLKKKFEV